MKNELILKVRGSLPEAALKELKKDLKTSTINYSNINNLHSYFISVDNITKTTINLLAKYNLLKLFIPEKNYNNLQEEMGNLDHLPWIQIIK